MVPLGLYGARHGVVVARLGELIAMAVVRPSGVVWVWDTRAPVNVESEVFLRLPQRHVMQKIAYLLKSKGFYRPLKVFLFVVV